MNILFFERTHKLVTKNFFMLKKYLIIFIIIPFIFISCGYYSFKGALPPDIKTIAIPLMDDNTSEAGVRESMTNILLEAFISDNTLTVVDENDADLVLTGTISSIRVKPFIVQAGENVSESQVVVTARFKCQNMKTSKVMFDKRLSEYGLMDISAGLDERNEAIEQALELIKDKVIDLTFGGW